MAMESVLAGPAPGNKCNQLLQHQAGYLIAESYSPFGNKKSTLECTHETFLLYDRQGSVRVIWASVQDGGKQEFQAGLCCQF